MAFACVQLAVVPALLVTVAILVFEFCGISLVNRRFGRPRWHAEHLAERYSLLIIVALGEGVVGTAAAMTAVVTETGWNLESALVVLSGIALTASMWWAYFYADYGAMLRIHADRIVRFIALHALLYMAIAAVGAGLHLVGFYVEHETQLSQRSVLLSVAIPTAVYIVALFAMISLLAQKWVFRLWLWPAMSISILALGVVCASQAVSIGWGLVILGCAPILCIFGSDKVARRLAS